MGLVVCGTGHRSEKCEAEDIVRTKARVKLQYPTKSGATISTFITGMANGLDLWAADEAIKLGIPVWAARPWAGHGPRRQDAELYRHVIDNAERVVDVNESKEYPGAWVYQHRNEWMVDNADVVMAYWDTVERGGTWNRIKYARAIGKPITNIWHSPPF